jgi:hypothetical protein
MTKPQLPDRIKSLGMTHEFIETVFDRNFSNTDDDTPEAQNEINEPTCQ